MATLQDERLVAGARLAFSLFNAAADLASLATGDVSSVATWGGTSTTTALQGIIKNKATTFPQHADLLRQIGDSMAWVSASGLITDATINGGTKTVAGIRTLFTNVEATLTGTAHPVYGILPS